MLVDLFKIERGCLLCGYRKHPRGLDLHHWFPEMKRESVSKMVRDGWSMRDIWTEVKRCAVLCATCHREVEAGVYSLYEIYQLSRQRDYELGWPEYVQHV